MYLEEDSLIFEELEFDGFIGEVEKALQVRFGNYDFYHAATFGEMVQVILNKLSFSSSTSCGTQKVFYLLRNELKRSFKEEIKPENDLNKLFKNSSRKNWKKIQQQTGLRLPKLELNDGQYLLYLIAVLATFVAFFIMFSTFRLGSIGFGASCFIAWMVNRFSNKLPVKTIRELVENVTEMNYAKVKQGKYTREEIESIITRILARQGDIPKEYLRYDLKIEDM